MTFATFVFQKVIIGMFRGQRQQGILAKKTEIHGFFDFIQKVYVDHKLSQFIMA